VHGLDQLWLEKNDLFTFRHNTQSTTLAKAFENIKTFSCDAEKK
jgi:hypothetical protein